MEIKSRMSTNKLKQLKDLKNINILDIKQFENVDRDRPEWGITNI